MPDADDLLPVILCELGERIIAMREALAEPSVAAKPHARAVAALLRRGLDALEARLQRDVLAQVGLDDVAPDALGALYQCGQAFRALHRRLGLLDLRWSAAPVDIFLRKLRDDAGMIDGVGGLLPHPAVVLSDDYAALDADVAGSLYADLGRAGVEVGTGGDAETVVALPRIEEVDPLSWPLLLPGLARMYLRRAPTVRLRQYSTNGIEVEGVTAVCLGGPTAFVVRAVHALLSTPGDAAVWPPYLWPMADAAEACAGGLEDLDGGGGVEGRGLGGVVAPFRRLLRARDEALGRREAYGSALSVSEEPWADVGLPRPDMPTAGEAAALLNKLVAGTPINAIDPPVPPDFLARLEGVSTPDLFYALIAPVGERPASLAAILGVGWLYKVRHSYPLFGRLLREHGDLGAALAAYRPHLLERGDLLAQSIEAAHVQGIFARGRREEAGIAARGGLDG